jgi:biopolymer transport protein ExbB/TolQ
MFEVFVALSIGLMTLLGLSVLLMRRVAVLQARLAAKEAETDELQQQLELVRQSISGLTAGAVGMDRRVNQLEQRERALSERQENYEIQQADEQPYGRAIRLVQQGAAVGRLVAELGISESEAELIVRLHGHRDSA